MLRKLKFYFVGKVFRKVFHGYAHLLHCVAVAHGDGAVLECVEVHGYAPGSTDFVLTAVALTDTAGGIVSAGKVLDKRFVNFVSFFGKIFL